VTHSSS